MIFTETGLKGAYILDLEMMEDSRGFFARSFCIKEFEKYGLEPTNLQCNISFNSKKGTLRGMHFQTEPKAEAKLVRCTRGKMCDVIVDVRTDSATYKKWVAVELSVDNRRSLYVPKGFAHGFQTLEDNTEVFYQMSEFYYPECSSGFRWDDPEISIEWPLEDKIISEKDKNLGQFSCVIR